MLEGAGLYRAGLVSDHATLVSPFDADSRWFAYTAMERNKLLYGFSDAALLSSVPRPHSLGSMPRSIPNDHRIWCNGGRSAVMDGEPNGHLFRIGPQDAVAPVRHDMNVIAGTQGLCLRFVVEEQPRAAPK